LELAPTVRHKLQRAGFRNVGDLRGCGPIDLAREAGLSHQEALLVLKVAFSADHGDEGIAGAISAEQVYAEEAVARSIVTFCEAIDGMLGGGVPTRAITEFCGVPGVGKTQLGMQIAVDVQIPACFGGLEGEAVYIDTEGSFMLERLVDIADALVAHVQALGARVAEEAERAQAECFTRDTVLHGIHHFRVHDAAEQIAVINTLPQFLANNPRVGLLPPFIWLLATSAAPLCRYRCILRWRVACMVPACIPPHVLRFCLWPLPPTLQRLCTLPSTHVRCSIEVAAKRISGPPLGR